MINNDVLRSIRYMLTINDAKMVEVIGLSDFSITKEMMIIYLKKDNEEGYQACPDEVMAHFLNGLIFFRRGKDDNYPVPPIEIPINNNMIMKKLRVAFELKDTDLQDIFSAADFRVSKHELNALFRKPDNKNYRPCGDQMLRYFLKGLTLRLRF